MKNGNIGQEKSENKPVEQEGKLVNSNVVNDNTQNLKQQIISNKKKKGQKKMSNEKIVTATFRLPESIFNGLIKASALRRIEGESPYKQKDIVAESLEQWLRKKGDYL